MNWNDGRLQRDKWDYGILKVVRTVKDLTFLGVNKLGRQSPQDFPDEYILCLIKMEPRAAKVSKLK
jgi:hypothetical protein